MEVVELTLCESKYLALQPDVLYRFVVEPTCATCAALATGAKIPE